VVKQTSHQEKQKPPTRLGSAHRLEIMRLLGVLNWQGRVLVDIGGYDGTISDAMTGYAHRLIVDPFLPARLQGSSAKAGLVRGVGQALPIRPGSADTVLLLDVLEHVEEPQPVLAEALRVLKAGGRCIVTVPSTHIQVFPPWLQGWVNKRWDHTIRSGYTVKELMGLITAPEIEVREVLQLGSPLFRFLYFPLSLCWRIAPGLGWKLLRVVERSDLRRRAVGADRGYLYCELKKEDSSS